MQVSSQAVLRWFHQRTMKRCADGQDRGAFRATLISKFGGPLHRRGVTGNDNLFRRIDIAGPQTSPCAASAQIAATLSKSIPRTAAIAPTPTGTASCIYLPRFEPRGLRRRS